MKQALIDYGIKLDKCSTTKGAIEVRIYPIQHSYIKHIEQLHQSLMIIGFVEKVALEDNIADMFTKPLKHELFNHLRLGLGMMGQID